MLDAESLIAAPARSRRSAATLANLTGRKAARSGAIWGYIFGAAIASSAISYARLYKTSAERDALAAAYGTNKATSALFGPAAQLQTVAGFTAFKISMTLIVLGAVWGLLTSTRLLRGEEDSGRWQLLLAGPTTRRRATGQALGGLAAGAVTLWALTAIITVVTGRFSAVSIAAGPALYFALAMVMTAVMFLAVGAVTSQLAWTRRQAAAYAAWFLGISYAIRLIADAGVGLHTLIWISPLGWVEELQPLTAPRPLALLPAAAFTAALVALAIGLSGRRDVAAGLVASRDRSQPRLGLLSGPIGLTIRLGRPVVLGWWVAIAVAALLFGLIARSAGGTLSGSAVTQVLSRLGARGGGAAAVLGTCFLILAVLTAFAAAGQITAARSEESDGRLDLLLARPVSRARWLAGRLLVAAAFLVLSGVLAGVFAFAGAASQHSGLSLAPLLDAGLNVVPPAIALLGIGALALGLWPRRAAIVIYAVLGWSLLVVVIGGIGGMSHWVLDTSVFHQMAAAPAVPPDWAAGGVMIAIGLAGGLALARRDVQGE